MEYLEIKIVNDNIKIHFFFKFLNTINVKKNHFIREECLKSLKW